MLLDAAEGVLVFMHRAVQEVEISVIRGRCEQASKQAVTVRHRDN